MGFLEAVAIFAAGMAAGTINTVVGSGTLITFPVLLAFGYAPVVANVSNTVGLVPGSAAGAVGYRRELSGQRRRVLWLACASLSGGVIGAVLLLSLPASAFEAIVPVFIAIALVLIVIQPRLSAWLTRHRPRARTQLGPAATLSVGAAGIYGGYFGAAQGVLLIGMLGIALNDSLQRINAAKNVLAGLVNGLAAVVFILATHIDWGVAGLIAAGSIIGGQVGARVGKRLPPWGLRVLIVCVGTAALVKLLT
jgi:uncharacterized membrane protein YfcA